MTLPAEQSDGADPPPARGQSRACAPGIQYDSAVGSSWVVLPLWRLHCRFFQFNIKHTSMTPYIISYTVRHDSHDFELHQLESETPFPAYSVGDFIEGRTLPPGNHPSAFYRVLHIVHTSQKLNGGVRHYIRLIICPDPNCPV